MRTTAKSSSSSSAPRRQPADPVLGRVKSPEDLAGLGAAELADLAGEIRGFLIEKVCAAGGHLGVNLGVVELTIALHRVFRSPHDVLLFDTGHQSYVHKILTGRGPGFDTLRRRGGLSGYPSRSESAHDWIENSHASTALSYADGLAKAFQLRGELADGSGDPARRHVVPVIGDGAMTGGLAWEGLNNLAGAADRPVVIVLNDNGRAYAPTIGGIATHLGGLRARAPCAAAVRRSRPGLRRPGRRPRHRRDRAGAARGGGAGPAGAGARDHDEGPRLRRPRSATRRTGCTRSASWTRRPGRRASRRRRAGPRCSASRWARSGPSGRTWCASARRWCCRSGSASSRSGSRSGCSTSASPNSTRCAPRRGWRPAGCIRWCACTRRS